MSTKKKMITDISAELDKKYGAPGTPEREIFDEEAYAFYTGQLLHDARKEAKVTQAELAKRINSTKSSTPPSRTSHVSKMVTSSRA